MAPPQTRWAVSGHACTCLAWPGRAGMLASRLAIAGTSRSMTSGDEPTIASTALVFQSDYAPGMNACSVHATNADLCFAGLIRIAGIFSGVHAQCKQ